MKDVEGVIIKETIRVMLKEEEAEKATEARVTTGPTEDSGNVFTELLWLSVGFALLDLTFFISVEQLNFAGKSSS